MPDFERLFRKAELSLARTPAERAALTAKHRRQDHDRWLIACAFTACLLAFLLFHLSHCHHPNKNAQPTEKASLPQGTHD